MEKLTLVQELQNELYGLFTTHLFILTGMELQEGDNPPETFIAKSKIVESCIKILNEFGKTLVQDERLKNDNNSK